MKVKNVSTYICLLAEDEKKKNLFLIMHISDHYDHSFFFSIPSLKKKKIAIHLKNAVYQTLNPAINYCI